MADRGSRHQGELRCGTGILAAVRHLGSISATMLMFRAPAGLANKKDLH